MKIILSLISFLLFISCNTSPSIESKTNDVSTYGELDNPILTAKLENNNSISIYRNNAEDPILIQNGSMDHRPYIHPIVSPDGKGILTEYSPGHHKHQTGLYWGFTRINGTGADEETLKEWFYKKDKTEEIKTQIGRDFFHHPTKDMYGDSTQYWIREDLRLIKSNGEEVIWETVYNMLDEKGSTIMVETQKWTMSVLEDKYILDLEWIGDAETDVTIGKFEYGGLFLRMPWFKGIKGEVVNAARNKNTAGEGKRAPWVDVGMEIKGMDKWGHIAIFDHPTNGGFPQPWRIDGNMGVGPSRAILGDWNIPKGSMEIIRHRFIVYTGELNDKQLMEEYVDYGGERATWVLWDIAQEEGKKEKFLNPQEAVDNMTIKDGYNVNAWASEPMITQPMAFCWDDKGRLWIAENRDYETRRTGFANDGNSRILILEDTDGDGKADDIKVYLEGIPFPSAIAVGFDGLFLGAPPHLLFVPDKDQDDVGEMDDVEILLTGWGIRDRHETINSLHWGPDGWIYGLEGFATPSVIRKPNPDTKLYGHKDEFPADLLDADGVDINGGVWRYHPTKKEFEVVAHGFSNPWGIDYDAKGQLFISACVIPHLFHVVPGGIFHRQGGKHFNPYVYSDIRTIVNHRHRSAHGGARVYLSDAFPEEQQGRLFMANIHENAVLSDVLESKGSGFVAHHGDDFMMANNAQWIGFSMELGPDGSLYVLDWHDADICGNDVVHKDTGRIFRISPETSLAKEWDGRYEDVRLLSDLELVRLQENKSSWHARRARIVLQHRASKGKINGDAINLIKNMVNTHTNSDYRLRALWTGHVSGIFTNEDLLSLLDDKDEYIRAWTIQLLSEDKNLSKSALEKFASMAEKDDSPVVRLYLAGSLQRMTLDDRWEISEELIKHEEDKTDHNIPHMIWFAIEPMVPHNPERALDLAKVSKIPMLTEYIAWRLSDASQLELLVSSLNISNPASENLMKGMLSGLEGLFDVKAPDNWRAALLGLESDPVLAKSAQAIDRKFGSIKAINEALANLKDKNESVEKRREALNSLANQRRQELEGVLPELIDEPELRIDAIRALSSIQIDASWRSERDLAWKLIERYNEFSSMEKLEIVQTLASRSSYGWRLTRAIRDGMVPKRDVPAYVARQLHRVVGSGFLETWGQISKVSNEKIASYEKYSDLLSADAINSANIQAGKTTYDGLCGACHVMYGEGGKIGPDLTGSNRTNIEYLLNNIVDPNSDLQDDYRMVLVTTRDGRTYAGNIISESDRTLTLRIVGQDQVIISKSDIQSKEVQTVSMMPEGMLDFLTDREVIDLIGFLQTNSDAALD